MTAPRNTDDNFPVTVYWNVIQLIREVLTVYLMLAVGLQVADITWVFTVYPHLNDCSTRLSTLQRRFGVVCANSHIMARILNLTKTLTDDIHANYLQRRDLPPTISHAHLHGNAEHLPIYVPPRGAEFIKYAHMVPTRELLSRLTRDKIKQEGTSVSTSKMLLKYYASL